MLTSSTIANFEEQGQEKSGMKGAKFLGCAKYAS